MRYFRLFLLVLFLVSTHGMWAQTRSESADRGSQTAKNGFKNEDEIRDKFNNWKTDAEAKIWLGAMGYKLAEIESVTATKPHGEKADVEIVVKTTAGEKKEGISIKLVSNTNGFNQIDKRWLSHYVKMWQMPAEVETALKLFVGETPPTKSSRVSDRMYLDEIDPSAAKAVVDFFAANRDMIVSDLFAGDGAHAAGWVMVALKT